MNISEKFETMKPDQFAALAINVIAYVKPVEYDGQRAFGVYRADGNQAAVAMTREQATALILENEMQPVSLH